MDKGTIDTRGFFKATEFPREDGPYTVDTIGTEQYMSNGWFAYITSDGFVKTCHHVLMEPVRQSS